MQKFFLLMVFALLAALKLFGQSCADPAVCWPFVVTADNHTIIITTNTNLTVNGVPLPDSSYIGVFFSDGGVLKSAGYEQWLGSNTSVTAFGNDGSSPRVGMLPGEVFKFKLLLPNGLIIDSANATFLPANPPIPSHTDTYVNNGISQLSSLSGFFDACDTLACNDNDFCTTDSCVNGSCIFTPMICDDNIACTADSCVNGVCSFTQIICDDNNACTTDSCVNGNCVFTPTICDDNVACTTDSCVNGVCSFTQIICDDNNTCTTDSCVNGTCVFTTIDCDDGDSLTSDSCVNGSCLHLPITTVANVFKDHEIKIIPNPAKDFLRIEANFLINEIRVFDVSGREIWAQKINEEFSLLDVYSLAAGIYFIKIQSEKIFIVKKFAIKK